MIEFGPRAGLDILEKKKFPFFCRESNDDPSVIQPIARSLQYDD
jgi:hypothetical protein